MSYAHNEHYKWVEDYCKTKCSELGRQVANILGYVGGGIYNAPINPNKIDWTESHCISVNWTNSLSNWDKCELTELIIECHRRMVRVSIRPNMRNLQLMFWQRNSRTGSISQRLPDIEDMVKMIDNHWGRD